MSYGRFLRQVLPGYLQPGATMQLLLDAVGATFDEAGERALLGRMAALPYAGSPAARRSTGALLQCDAEVLPYHARDREITLYATEPESSQRYRLSRWRQLHAERGTHRGAMRHLQPYFLGATGLGVLPRLRVVHQDGAGAGATWHTLTGTNDTGGAGIYSIHREVPSNWDFDGQASKWSRWWGIIYLSGTAFSTISHWDDGIVWNGGAIWDGIRRAVLLDWIAMFRDWGAAHAQCAGIILARSLSDFNPTGLAASVAGGGTTLPVGNWGRLVDPVTGLRTRLPTATWIYDVYFSGP